MSDWEKYCKHESREGICRAVRSIAQCPYGDGEKPDCEHYDSLFPNRAKEGSSDAE